MNIAKFVRKGSYTQTEPWYKRTVAQKWIFLALAVVPSFLGYVLFTLYPNALSAYYSFLKWDGVGKKEFVGLQNYKDMYKDPFVWRDLVHNGVLMLLVPISVILISLSISYILNYKSYREGGFYKILYFFPNILSTVIITLLWSFIYNGSFGLLNYFLKAIGINVGEFWWLGDKRTALLALVPPMVWSGVGFYVVIFMNAMKAIPSSLYEHATLEGANHRVKLFKITIPLISGIIRVAALFLSLNALKGFELVLILTQGKPEGATDVIGLYMYGLAFGSYGGSDVTNTRMFGYASAVGMLLFSLLLIIKLIVDKIVPNDSIEY